MASLSKILVVVPSRGRPDAVEEIHKAFTETGTGRADLLVVLDSDDEQNYPRIDGVQYLISPRKRPGMNDAVNFAVSRYWDEYAFIGFMGDDHRPRTVGWDEEIYDTLVGTQPSVVYGNDLLQGENLATAVFMDSRLIKTLGFMSPPDQLHLYLDNFWMLLGRATTLVYLPNVIIEHMHYSIGKSEQDETYVEVNSSAFYDHDRVSYENYVNAEWENDLAKLKEEGLA